MSDIRFYKKSKAEVLEQLRHALVFSMIRGETLVLNCGLQTPDWLNDFTCEKSWPAADIFNFEKWRQSESYMKVVSTEENWDIEHMN